MYQPNLKSLALPIPEITAIEVLGLRTANLGKEEAVVSPQFPHVPLTVGGCPLGYEERRYWANSRYN